MYQMPSQDGFVGNKGSLSTYKKAMNAKQSKKLRQLFRREYKQDAYKLADQHMRFLKPRPRYFPLWLWIKLLGIFIKIK
jgi:hypothetical protein